MKAFKSWRAKPFSLVLIISLLLAFGVRVPSTISLSQLSKYVLFLGVLGTVATIALRSRGDPKRIIAVTALSSYPIALLLSVLTTGKVGQSVSGSFLPLLWMLGLICGSLIPKTVAELPLICGALFLSVFAVYGWLTKTNVFVSGDLYRAQALDGGPLSLSFFAGVACLTAFSVVRTKPEATSYGIIGWVLLSVVIITFTRAALLGLTVGGLILQLGASKGQKLLYYSIVLALISISLLRSQGTANGRSAMDSALSRPRIWYSAVCAFIKSPVTGVGAGEFTYAYTTEVGETKTQHGLAEPKSLYLLPIVELGLVGLIAVSIGSGSLYLLARSHLNLGDTFVPATLSFVATYSFFDTPAFALGTYQGTVVLGYLIGVSCQPHIQAETSNQQAPLV